MNNIESINYIVDNYDLLEEEKINEIQSLITNSIKEAIEDLVPEFKNLLEMHTMHFQIECERACSLALKALYKSNPIEKIIDHLYNIKLSECCNFLQESKEMFITRIVELFLFFMSPKNISYAYKTEDIMKKDIIHSICKEIKHWATSRDDIIKREKEFEKIMPQSITDIRKYDDRCSDLNCTIEPIESLTERIEECEKNNGTFKFIDINKEYEDGSTLTTLLYCTITDHLFIHTTYLENRIQLKSHNLLLDISHKLKNLSFIDIE